MGIAGVLPRPGREAAHEARLGAGGKANQPCAERGRGQRWPFTTRGLRQAGYYRRGPRTEGRPEAAMGFENRS
jgi:hypothetical protein